MLVDVARLEIDDTFCSHEWIEATQEPVNYYRVIQVTMTINEGGVNMGHAQNNLYVHEFQLVIY